MSQCPQRDDVAQAAATAAYNLMVGAADQVPGNNTQTSVLPNVQATSILAPQRYRVQGGGTGIEFDPTDPLYTYVTSAMKADLAFAQLASPVAKFLSDGLKAGYAADDGHTYPHLPAVPALADFSFHGSVTSHIRDSSSQDDSHSATVSSRPWCGALAVTIAETVDKSFQFAPLEFDDINMWRKTVPSYFHGTGHGSMTPFNGPAGANPYLIVSINGQTQAFHNYSYANCWNNPGFRCSSTIEVDPTGYLVAADIYDPNGALVGTQSNPFPISQYQLVADPLHQGNWGTQVVNGVQEWGKFTKPVMRCGVTKYMYTKQY